MEISMNMPKDVVDTLLSLNVCDAVEADVSKLREMIEHTAPLSQNKMVCPCVVPPLVGQC